MAIKIIEFKARVNNIHELENKLKSFEPDFIGEDHQVDTYFNVEKGRLKLREGNIENSLIWYQRDNVAGAKRSDVILYKHVANKELKTILEKLHGILVVVDKRRKIYFIGNIKFHFDTVAGLGEFIEVEAIDNNGDVSIDILEEQCRKYAALFEIKKENYVAGSYSDMVMIEKQ
ncbi:MAG TPA: class IV adenylate cyclase [Ferruginibacter sp.]|nr:class IV adenylate cyclase [Ferruginibacter sp.]